MTGGFDTSSYVRDSSPRVAEDGAGWAAPPEPGRDVWNDGAATIAAAATSAELTADKPFSADLNKLFRMAGCARYAGKAWERLCLGLHAFTDRSAQAALAAGWEPIELLGIARSSFQSEDEPITSPRGLRFPAFTSGAALMIGKREVVEVEAEFIRFVADRLGSIHTLYREHHMSGRGRSALCWEVPLF